MHHLVISTSLHPTSRSRVLAKQAYEHLREHDASARWLDAAELDLPMCDGAEAYKHAGTQTVIDAITAADGILMAYGVYNYGASATAKTFLELGGRAWTGKVAAFACAAGGRGSYMAPMGLANALMLDFRTVVVPRFVFATGADFDDDHITADDVHERLDAMVTDLVTMTRALRGGVNARV